MKRLLSLLFLLFSVNTFGLPVEDGKNLFKSRCVNCHKVNDVFVGPALAGLHERRSMDWIIKFVQSSQTMIKAGDKDAIALFEKFKVPMPDQMDLSEVDIKNIVEYIKAEASAAPVASSAPFAKPTSVHPAYLPVTTADKGFFITFIAVVALLVGTLIFYAKVKQYEKTKVW